MISVTEQMPIASWRSLAIYVGEMILEQMQMIGLDKILNLCRELEWVIGHETLCK